MTAMASTPQSDVAQAISDLHRTEWGRIVAILIRLVGNFALTEKTAQEAFVAVNQWQTTSVQSCSNLENKAVDAKSHIRLLPPSLQGSGNDENCALSITITSLGTNRGNHHTSLR
jgi:hypothetical protein